MSESESSGSDSAYEYVSSVDSTEEDESDNDSQLHRSPWSRFLRRDEIAPRVAQLAATECCDDRCLSDTRGGLERFVNSMNQMSKEAKKTALLTALAISCSTDLGQRKRGYGKRTRYPYLMPYCGCVCKVAFQVAYDISHATLAKARKQVQEGEAYAKSHGNKENKHASKDGHEQALQWFRSLANKVGEPCPMRFQRQRSSGGTVVRYTTRQDIIFLPAFLTWKTLYDEYKRSLMVDASAIAFTTFYTLLTRRCKDIRIRSPRSHVCDTCATYRALSTSRSLTASEAENQAQHALDARAMRQQYAKDSGLVGSRHFVSTIDYAQNVTLPHVASTPSAWYFMSLIGVSVFGVFLENNKKQTNFIYSERAAGKGSNEVVSMLHEYAIANKIYSAGPGTSSWTVYADNCGGQSKNSHLIRYLLFLVDSGRLRSANLYFLVKGHTKNNCDRGFGLIKRSYARKDLYTIEQVHEMVEASSSSNSSVCLEDRDDVFYDWKQLLTPVYNDVKGIQRYQLFNMSASYRGVVMCRKRPSGETVEQSLRKTNIDIEWESLWTQLTPVARPAANPEKVNDLHKKILPFIPEEYRSDRLYRAPTEAEVEEARARKRRRTKTTPRLAERLETNVSQ